MGWAIRCGGAGGCRGDQSMNRRYYTSTGFVAGVSYLYLLLRFGSVLQDVRGQGGTLTLEMAVWRINFAIMAIIGLGVSYRLDESDLASIDSDGLIQADRHVQQAKMAQYATCAGLVLVAGVSLLSLLQSIGADLERRQKISNATVTYVVATQQVQGLSLIHI